MVNISHILMIESNQSGADGCNIVLTNGTSFRSIEHYDTVIGNIINAKE